MPSFVMLRAKPARKRKPAGVGVPVSERSVQITLIRYIKAVVPGADVFAIPNAEAPRSSNPNARMAFQAKRRTAGVLPSVPDLAVVPDDIPTFYVEVKKPGGVLEARQDELHQRWRRKGHVVIVADSIESLRLGLRAAGIPLRESAAEPAAPARVRLAKPRAPIDAPRLPI